MKIYTKIVWSLTPDGMVLDSEESFLYDGKIDKLCGATAAQTSTQAAQANAYTQMTQQAQQIFGADNSVFQSLQSTFAPTIAAGPSQQGFSAGEVSNLNSQAITENGTAARNAKQATGEAVAAQGGGNNAALQSGVDTGIEANINASSANNTANELGQIQQADYTQGNTNYNNAVGGLAAATNTFNSASTAGSAATGAGVASSNTANEIAQQNNSWMQAVSGALGGVASAATGGLTGMLGGGSGDTANAGANSANTGASSVDTGAYTPQ